MAPPVVPDVEMESGGDRLERLRGGADNESILDDEPFNSAPSPLAGDSLPSTAVDASSSVLGKRDADEAELDPFLPPQSAPIDEGMFYGPFLPTSYWDTEYLGGYTVPGSAPHCGPGNRYSEYPRSFSDALCRRHDLSWVFNQADQEEAFFATYKSFNEADEELLHDFYINEAWREGTSLNVGVALFELKRKTLPRYSNKRPVRPVRKAA